MPEPFQFEMRNKVKPKSIREQRLQEMLTEQKLSEPQFTPFKSKPVPASTLEPRFEAISSQKASHLKTPSKDAPFSFWEREKERL